MPLLRRRARVLAEIPTASMADIGFLLLIFFLTTTIFDEERGLPVTLPAPGEAAEVAPADVLHLRVRADGRVEARLGATGPGRTVDPASVGELWRRAVAANPRLVASVETEGAARYADMIAVLDALRAAGAARVALRAAEGGGR